MFGILGLLFFILMAQAGKPLVDVKVYVEDLETGDIIASQEPSKQGLVSFNQLKKGTYRLVVVLPKQEGKYIDNKDKKYRVAYHSAKRIYMLQEPIGFFVFRYSGLKNLTSSKVIPMYETHQLKNNKLRHIIGKFEVKNKQGSLTMEIDALTSRKFQKIMEQVRNDPELVLVSRVKTYSFFTKKME